MIVTIKASLPGIKVFMREYQVDAKMSLYRLHEFLSRDLRFAPDQMTLFESLDRAGKVSRTFGLFDMGDGSMDRITIENLISEEETQVRYIYNIDRDFTMLLVIDGEVAFDKRAVYPMKVAEKGADPDQFSDHYDDFDPEEARKIRLTPSRGESEEREDDEDFDDDPDDEKERDDEEGYDEEELPEGKELF